MGGLKPNVDSFILVRVAVALWNTVDKTEIFPERHASPSQVTILTLSHLGVIYLSQST